MITQHVAAYLSLSVTRCVERRIAVEEQKAAAAQSGDAQVKVKSAPSAAPVLRRHPRRRQKQRPPLPSGTAPARSSCNGSFCSPGQINSFSTVTWVTTFLRR